MEFWQGFIALSLLAMLFVLWPTFFGYLRERKALRQHDGGGAHEEVYREQLEELEKTRVMGEVDSEHFETLKQDLAKTFRQDQKVALNNGDRAIVSGLRSRLPIVAVAFLLPFFAAAIYWSLGAKDDWNIHQLAEAYVNSSTKAESVENSAQLVRTLQARLINSPENLGNWYLLASTSASMGNYDESVRAYRELRELEPGSPFILAELAQALFLRAGNVITSEVRELTQLSLSLNPNMTTALGLGGIDAYQTADYPLAITLWERAVSLLDPASSASQALSQGVARAKIALGNTGGVSSQKESAVAAIDVKVEIDSSKLTLNGDETVFVYARAWQGAKMPLAIKRFSIKDLPSKVTLDSSSAMAPGMDISSVSQLEIVARVSSSGLATPQSGDWLATAGPIFLNSQKGPVILKITEQIP